MTEENITETQEQNSQEAKQVSINTQYIKDLSFENPKAPASLIAKDKRPDIKISVDVVANKAGDDLYEVVLMLSAKALNGEDAVFLTDLTYGGIFTIKNIEGAELEQTLLIFAPSLLFPFARRIIADTTRDGGFPPLMLDPIDFGSLYQQKIVAMQEQQSQPDA